MCCFRRFFFFVGGWEYILVLVVLLVIFILVYIFIYISINIGIYLILDISMVFVGVIFLGEVNKGIKEGMGFREGFCLKEVFRFGFVIDLLEFFE